MEDLVGVVKLKSIIGTSAPGIGKSEFRIPLVVLSPSMHKTGIIALLIISTYRINSNTKSLHFLVNFMVDSYCSTAKIELNVFLLLQDKKKCLEEYFSKENSILLFKNIISYTIFAVR